MREASVTVEELVGASDRAEALEVLAEAFSGHPMVPADPPGRPRYWCARVMMGTMLEVFDKAPGAGLLGVRAEGELACVGFVHDYGYEPKGWDLVKMMWRVVRVLGVARMFEAMRVMSEKHAGEGRKLELLILGTRADHQQRGFGRAVMREVIRRAEAGGYEAVTLEVAKGTPAEGFYEREGFVGGKELAMKAGVLVMMRREITGTGD